MKPSKRNFVHYALVYLQEQNVKMNARIWLPHHLQCQFTRQCRKAISFVRNQFLGVRDKFSESFKVNRLRGKEEICLIDISTPLGGTYDADDEKEIAAKMGQFEVTKSVFISTEKTTIEYLTISKWLKNGRTLDRRNVTCYEA